MAFGCLERRSMRIRIVFLPYQNFQSNEINKTFACKVVERMPVMGEFTKTLIVDNSLINPQHPYYKTIKEAADYLNGTLQDPDVPPIPGTIIVESGTYVLDEPIDNAPNNRTTISISNNVTLIGRGNVVISLRRHDISAFRNTGPYQQTPTSNENITISGLKIVLNMPQNGAEYGHIPDNSTPPDPTKDKICHVIHLVNVKHCRVEKVHITCDPSSSFGVYPGNENTADYENLYPAAAICIESNHTTGEPAKEYCTDNMISQCVITEFGKTVGGALSDNRYGIGILVKRGNRNRIVFCHVSKAKLCCIVEQGDFNIVKNNIFRDPVIAPYSLNKPQLNTLCLLVRERYLTSAARIRSARAAVAGKAVMNRWARGNMVDRPYAPNRFNKPPMGKGRQGMRAGGRMGAFLPS
jgi:hypothetical protein